MSPVFRTGRVKAAGEGGAGKFVKLEAEKPLDLIIMWPTEKMISFDQHAIWRDEGASPMFPCIKGTGKKCPGCEIGDKPRFRGVMPVVEQTDAEKTVKIWSFGIQTARDLQDIEDATGNLVGLLIRVKRTGTGLKTRYSVVSLGKKFNVERLVSKIPDIAAELGPTDPAEIRRMLAGGDIEEDDVEVEEPVEEPKKKGRAKKAAPEPEPPAKEPADEEAPEEPMSEDELDSIL